jgi:hypothetical protein
LGNLGTLCNKREHYVIIVFPKTYPLISPPTLYRKKKNKMIAQTKTVKKFLKKFNLLKDINGQSVSVNVERKYFNKREYEYGKSNTNYFTVPYSKWLELIELSENEFKNAEEKDKWIYRSVADDGQSYIKKDAVTIYPSRDVVNYRKELGETFENKITVKVSS